MNAIVKNKKILIATIVIFVIGLFFYWYEWRPSQIRRKCVKIAIEEARRNYKSFVNQYDEENRYSFDIYALCYKKCLNARGLEK